MPVKPILTLAALLLATAACTTTPPPEAAAPVAPVAAVQPAPVVQPAADPAAEDRRLMAFLDAAFEEQIARSPQALTALGRKDQYDRPRSPSSTRRRPRRSGWSPPRAMR